MSDELTPAELKPIVEAWGGPEKFAKLIDAKERTVKAWLYGERNIKPPIAKLIRSLKPQKPRKVKP
jgi:DNA-binding transcriptional regulator YiaG